MKYLLSLFLWTVISFSSLFAGIIPVTTLADNISGSLREAVTLAVSGDTISIALRGIIPLDSQLIIEKNLTIIGPGPDQLTLSGQDQDRIFSIEEGDTLNLVGLDIAFGDVESKNQVSDPPVGGLVVCKGGLIARECTFREGKAVDGGGIVVDGFDGKIAFLHLENCAIYNNTATISNPTFLKNGGGISGDARQGGQAIVIGRNVTITQNEALRSGGAVFLIGDPSGGARFECTNCTIGDNKASLAGGVDNSQAEGNILKNSILSGNEGAAGQEDYLGTTFSNGHNIFGNGAGGTLDAQPTDFVLTDPLLGPFGFNSGSVPVKTLRCESPAIDNGDDGSAPSLDSRGQGRVGTSDIGAYERNDQLDLAVTFLTDDGGGSLRQAIELICPDEIIDLSQLTGRINIQSAFVIDKPIEIQGNTQNQLIVDGNDSIRLFEVEVTGQLKLSDMILADGGPQGSTGGGAILNFGKIDIRNVTFYSCEASSGGAIGNYGVDSLTSLRLENCTFSRNRARDLDGGAIDNRSIGNTATAELINCTLMDNEALNRGGALNNIDGSISIKNTLIGRNTAFEGHDGFGTFISNGSNLVIDTVEMEGIIQSSDLIGMDPEVEDLRFNVGPTAIYLPLPTSPLIDAGQNDGVAQIDQLGNTRIVNGQVDIGSVEFLPGLNSESVSQAEFIVYPNPAHESVWFSWESEWKGEVDLRLYNLQGQVVLAQKVSQYTNSSLIELKTGHLPAGQYFITAQSALGTTHQMLIISHD